MKFALRILSLLVLISCVAAIASGQSLRADYQFQGNLNTTGPTAPPLSNLTGSGGANSFVTDTVDGYTRQTLRFPFNSGLQLSPSFAAIPNGASYTIVILVRFDQISGFRRVASFDGRTSDDGAYIQDGRLEFESTANVPFVANNYIQLVIVREASGTVRGYRDGVQRVNQPDGGTFQISAANVLSFFQDDTAVPNEASAGNVARIRLYDAPMTTAQVQALERLPNATGGGEQSIVFTSQRDGYFEIYTMNPDGTNQFRLTNDAAYQESPKWSPDGTKIVIESDQFDLALLPEIVVMNANGTNPVRLTNNTFNDAFPEWSPNGDRIAFTSNRDGNNEIYVMNANGSNPVRLTSNAVDDRIPCWSPNGAKIAFTSARDQAAGEIYVMNADGTSPVRLTNNTATDNQCAWSPDGTKIAFWSARDANDPEIYVMNADGSNQVRLTNSPGNDFRPAWSPDGSRLMFISPRNNTRQDLWVMNADGANLTRLTANTSEDFSPNWKGMGGGPTPTPTPTPMCEPPPSGIIGWWPGEGNANDISGNGNNGTLNNGVAFGPGNVGQSFAFNGANNVVITNSPVLNPTSTITIETWIRPTGGQNVDRDIVSKDGENTERQYLLTISTLNRLRAHVGTTTQGFRNVDGTTVVPLNTWTHAVMTYDGTTLRVFLNGVQENTLAVSGAIITTTQPVRIGGGANAGQPQLFFPGSIDEATIYNRALSQAEITALFNAGSAGKCSSCTPAPISYGQTLNSGLAAASCIVGSDKADLYTFTGTANQQVAISLETTQFFSKIELLNPAGAVIASAGGVSGVNNSRLPATGYFTLAVAGTYTIRAIAAFGGAGSYNISLFEAPVQNCTYSLSPSVTTAAPFGATYFFDVVSQPGCPPASQPASSGVIYNNLRYNGGRVSFNVSTNEFPAARTDTITVAGQTHTINQFGLAAPANDAFGSAQVVTGLNSPPNAPVVGYNTTATAENGEPTHAGSPATRSVWYRYTPAANASGLYSFSTSGSSFDTVMAVYACPTSGACTFANMTPVGSNDDTTFFDITSKVNFRADGGTTYMIAVDGKNGASGTVNLSWRQYQRLFRLYLQTYNGTQSPLIPDTVTASNGSNTVIPLLVSLGVYEFNLPSDGTTYIVTITGPTGIVWDPNNFPLDTSFRYLDELMRGDGTAGGQNSVSNAQNQTPRFITGYIRNITSQELTGLGVIIGSSRGPNPREETPCSPLGSQTIATVQYATYQCLSQPNTLHDIVPNMAGKIFTVSVLSFDVPINTTYNGTPGSSFIATNTPTFNINGTVIGGGAGTEVALVYTPTGNTQAITLRQMTPASGAFAFPNLAPNTYQLRATRTGAVFTQPAPVNLQSNQTIDIPLESACSFTPGQSPMIPVAGGLSQIMVNTSQSTCEWLAASDVPWITINSGAIVGNGPVHFTAQANAGGGRIGSIRIQGRTEPILIQQATTSPTFGTLAGRVLTPDGRALRNAVVTIIDAANQRTTVTTSSFGVYNFANVQLGQIYTATVSSKRYRFAPRTLAFTGNLSGVEFVGLE